MKISPKHLMPRKEKGARRWGEGILYPRKRSHTVLRLVTQPHNHMEWAWSPGSDVSVVGRASQLNFNVTWEPQRQTWGGVAHCISSLFPNMPTEKTINWIISRRNLLFLPSTFNLALLIGFLRLGGSTWLGTQAVTLTFHNKTTVGLESAQYRVLLSSRPALRGQVSWQ